AAIGCHLHFEVRLGENDYANTRNPELWMLPNRSEEGVFNGAIAGRLMGLTGYPIPDVEIEIQRLGEDGAVVHTLYTTSYADLSVNGDDVWGENFAVGNLIPGQYQIQFIANGLKTYTVEVKPGQVAFIDFQFGED
ncbi:MAG: carboxypeptidase-like regulatory domain-containing protein, partial [Chloroflexota bacterium]|nr:carboxypeptidase-like regulatory domain-containing protein [Chloroflexota bacterium]